MLRWGTGAINVDACRFGYGDPIWIGPNEGATYRANVAPSHFAGGAADPVEPYTTGGHEGGRWPANLVYFPKASTAEREAGCDGLPAWSGADITERQTGSDGLSNPRAGAGRTSSGRRNVHPTVKPIRLMRWLCRLVGGQPGSLVIDPYTGSGTTGIAATLEGFEFRGSELNNSDGPPPQRFVDIATARIAYWREHGPDALDVYRDQLAARKVREELEKAGQVSLF